MSFKHKDGDPACKTKNPAKMRELAKEMTLKWDPPPGPGDYDWVWDNEKKCLRRWNAVIIGGGDTFVWEVFVPPTSGLAKTQYDAIEATKKIDGWRGRCPYCGEFYAEDGDTEEHALCKEIWESPGKFKPGQEPASWARRTQRNDTPDPDEYDILKTEEVGRHLLVDAKYPSCEACSYEGRKLLVYTHTSREDALKWKKLDPHFRDTSGENNPREAPSPRARFPATPAGWNDARLLLKALGS